MTSETSTPSIAFIGAGNMTTALVGGLIQHGYPAEKLCVSDPDTEKCQLFQRRFGVKSTENNREAANGAAIWVLAVKPQQIKTVVRGLAPCLLERRIEKTPLVLSIAAGITTTQLQAWLNNETNNESIALVRCMPNTPALVQKSASVLFATNAVSPEQKEQAERLLQAVGATFWVEQEALLHPVTALSGSGPAYFFYVMEALIAAGIDAGLPRDLAEQLVRQTALGAAELAYQSPASVALLRQQVTSPGGTTEKALQCLAAEQVDAHFQQAVVSACARSIELSKHFD